MIDWSSCGPPRQATDLMGRIVAQKLFEPLGQQVLAANAMKFPDTGERLAASGLELDYRRPEEFARSLKEQRERFGDIIKKNNIRIE